MGIVPDRTPIAEALKHITQIYANDTRFSLEYLDPPETGIKLTSHSDGSSILIMLNLYGNSPTQNVPSVNEISFIFQNIPDNSMLSLGNLSLVLGRPTDIILYGQNEIPQSILVYQNRQVYAFSSYGECNNPTVDAPVYSLMVFGHRPTDIRWLSDLMTWKGFNVCNKLKNNSYH
jgi:hypothetical protein